MRKTLLTMVLLLCAAAGKAQLDPEYRAEVGIGGAMTAYQGDFNSSLTKNMQGGVAAVGKYRFNPRMALSLNVLYGKLKGSSADVATWMPEITEAEAPVEFSKTLVDAGIRFEYNFWPYGTGREYRGAVRLTPYIALGLGLTSASGGEESAFTANVPMGVGVKYKLATRLNLALEWIMRFSLSDKLDGVADPYGIKSSGAFKNTDCYSGLQLSITYDILAKCKTCNNDRY